MPETFANEEELQKFTAWLMSKLDAKANLGDIARHSEEQNKQALLALTKDVETVLQEPLRLPIRERVKLGRDAQSRHVAYVIQKEEEKPQPQPHPDLTPLHEIRGQIEEGNYPAAIVMLDKTTRTLARIPQFQERMIAIKQKATEIGEKFPTFTLGIGRITVKDRDALENFLIRKRYASASGADMAGHGMGDATLRFSLTPANVRRIESLIGIIGPGITEADQERYESLPLRLTEGTIPDTRMLVETGAMKDATSSDKQWQMRLDARTNAAMRAVLESDPQFTNELTKRLTGIIRTGRALDKQATPEARAAFNKELDGLLDTFADAARRNMSALHTAFSQTRER